LTPPAGSYVRRPTRSIAGINGPISKRNSLERTLSLYCYLTVRNSELRGIANHAEI